MSVGERQRIEIVRALMQNPKFLILDEPTAVLTPQEADQLFVVLERLKAEGRAVLYISHKLEEVKRLCDTATILRGGKKVATCNPQAGDRSFARADDGRRRDQGSEGGRRPADHGAAPRRQRSLARARRAAWRAARAHLARAERRRNPRHRRRRRQRTGRTVRRAVRRTPVEGSRHDRDRRPCRRPSLDHAAPQARRGLRARGAARPRHRAAHEAFGECAAHRARRQRHGPSRLHRYRRHAEDGRPRHRDVRRPQGQARSGSRKPLRRQFAEIHRRTRDPAQSRRCWW